MKLYRTMPEENRNPAKNYTNDRICGESLGGVFRIGLERERGIQEYKRRKNRSRCIDRAGVMVVSFARLEQQKLLSEELRK